MFKSLRVLLIFVFISLVFSTIPISQYGLVTFFGPEIFVRKAGKPITETREFSALEFQAPYILHLRNGMEDGSKRVSSANVWLNEELLYGPSDFSQRVWGYDKEVELKEQNKLEVEIKSIPGSMLKIWIEGIPPIINPYEFEPVIITPSGGRFYLPNGIILDIPEGSLTETNTIRFRQVKEEEINPAFENYNLNEKYFLAAIQVEPQNIAFGKSIKVIIPSAPIRTQISMPLHFTVNLENKIYNYTPTDLLFDRENERVEFLLDGSSVHAILGVELANLNSLTLQGIPESVRVSQNDWQGHSDCDTIETACRCKSFSVTETSQAQLIEGECQLVVVSGAIHYVDCEGAAPETWGFEEYDRGYIQVETPEPIKVGDVYKFSASVVNSRGENVGGMSLRFSSLSPEYIEVIDPYSGLVKAKKCGEGKKIKIEAGCGVIREVIVDIWSPIQKINIIPPEVFLNFDSSEPLFAELLDEKGELVFDDNIDWSSNKPEIVSVEGTGPTIVVKSFDRTGEVEITAKAGCEEVPPGKAIITVVASDIRGTWNWEDTNIFGEVYKHKVSFWGTPKSGFIGDPVTKSVWGQYVVWDTESETYVVVTKNPSPWGHIEKHTGIVHDNYHMSGDTAMYYPPPGDFWQWQGTWRAWR